MHVLVPVFFLLHFVVATLSVSVARLGSYVSDVSTFSWGGFDFLLHLGGFSSRPFEATS